ncbi:hypothetical protein [Fuerstiella marisgermanici]|uniref:Uncharacterized protein n=1 Tax=Fuerstiella marisgermanici TaxID=1891926 RepID=A0A1P8WB72_9PLAN|nr:hypothetical protein [Fuerstiella marisgermanici]APZ91308.1 hypothetical protein Fuma_00896 [Fuerstiella marisgermanici]
MDIATLQQLALESIARFHNLPISGQILAAADSTTEHPWFELQKLANRIGLPVHPLETDGQYLCCPCCDSVKLEAFSGDIATDHFSAVLNEQQIKSVGHADFHEVPSSITVRTFIACQSCRVRFAVVLEDHATGRVCMSLVELPGNEGDI